MIILQPSLPGGCVCVCVCVWEQQCVPAYRVCAKYSDDFGQGHVPEFVSESSGHQPLGCMEDVVLDHKEPVQKG